MELGGGPRTRAESRLMARQTRVHSIGSVATMIGENLELIEVISSNSDNIDYGEMISIDNGDNAATTAFTDRGIESLEEFLAEVRTWDGGIGQFLIDEQCDPDVIERIMADEKKS